MANTIRAVFRFRKASASEEDSDACLDITCNILLFIMK